MWLTRIAIYRPVVIWMFLAGIAIMGGLAWIRLPAELNPQVEIPTLSITTTFPGAGPHEVESLVTKPLEDAIGSVNGIKDVFSTSQDSVSILNIDFNLGTDLSQAAVSLREKSDAARALMPRDVGVPSVARLDINAQPVLYVAIASRDATSGLRHTVDSVLKPRISRVAGVSSVNVLGGERNEIRVEASAGLLAQSGIGLGAVAAALQRDGTDVSGGEIVAMGKSTDVRTLGAFLGIGAIRSTPIFVDPQHQRTDLSPLTVGDVADVIETSRDPDTLNRVDGVNSVSLVVTRSADANTLSVVSGVRSELNGLRAYLPADCKIVFSRDDSITVRDALADVNTSLFLGALLAMAVVFLFLHNLRGTVIVALALPACIVTTFLAMYGLGYTLNQMTLLGLSLSVGILIDDSIVVLESITRHLRLGETPVEAAFNGRTEIGFADITTTLADVVVYLPIAFMGGIVGAFFRQFGLTVVVATLTSLVVSFTVTPCLASRWYRQSDAKVSPRSFGAAFERRYQRLEQLYAVCLSWTLARRGWAVAWSAVALVVVALVTVPSLGSELLPAADQGQVVVTVQAAAGSSLAATDQIVRAAERRIAGIQDVESYVTTVGEVLGGFGSTPQDGPEYAQINVRLTERRSLVGVLTGRISGRTKSDADIAAILRLRLSTVSNAQIAVAPVRSVADTGPEIDLELRGDDLTAVGKTAEVVRKQMETMPGILNTATSLRNGKPELRVQVERARAVALGLAPSDVGALIHMAIAGELCGVLRAGEEDIPIRVELAGARKSPPQQLLSTQVTVGRGGPVLVGDVARVTDGTGPAAVQRVNGARMVSITANLTPGYSLSKAQEDVNRRLARLLTSGITAHWGGDAAIVGENTRYFAMALGLAVILVYLVMASLFNSLLNPLVIMFTLPMALTGALAALVMAGETLSLVSMIGIIMLVGLMGRNAILLIDYTSTLRQRGMARPDAVLQAGKTRLRPILMTTLATIAGMLPVALRLGRASEIRAPMAIAVIGGLTVSTLLTLIVIPCLYTIVDDAAGWRNDRVK